MQAPNRDTPNVQYPIPATALGVVALLPPAPGTPPASIGATMVDAAPPPELGAAPLAVGATPVSVVTPPVAAGTPPMLEVAEDVAAFLTPDESGTNPPPPAPFPVTAVCGLQQCGSSVTSRTVHA